MKSCSSIINSTLEHFTNDAQLSGISFIKEFPNVKCSQPMRKPIVSIGVDKVVVENKEKTILGEGMSPCLVDLKIMICVPIAQGGSVLYGLLDKIMVSVGSLLKKNSIYSVSTEDARYSSTINGLVIPMTISINAGQMC